jgi:hypothetical protein
MICWIHGLVSRSNHITNWNGSWRTRITIISWVMFSSCQDWNDLLWSTKKRNGFLLFSQKHDRDQNLTRIITLAMPVTITIHYQRGTKSSRLYWTSLDRISLLFLTVYPCLINQSYFGKGKGDDKLWLVIRHAGQCAGCMLVACLLMLQQHHPSRSRVVW